MITGRSLMKFLCVFTLDTFDSNILDSANFISIFWVIKKEKYEIIIKKLLKKQSELI